jgi:hypothetical protein
MTTMSIAQYFNDQAIRNMHGHILLDSDINQQCCIINDSPVSIIPEPYTPESSIHYENPKVLYIFPARIDAENYFAKSQQMIEGMTGINKPAVFEVKSINGIIQCGFYAEEADAILINSNFKNIFLNSYSEFHDEKLSLPTENLHVYNFKPDAPFYLAATSFFSFEKSPQNVIIDLFSKIHDYAALQIVFMPFHGLFQKVREAIDTDWQSQRPRDDKLPPTLQTANERLKYKSPDCKSFFAVNVRIILPSDKYLPEVKAFISQYNYGNKPYKILDRNDYAQEQIKNMYLNRSCYESGFIMNSHELSALLHPCFDTLEQKQYNSIFASTPPGDKPDATTQYDDIPIGTWHCGNSDKVIHLPNQREIPHVHVLGVSRTGKSVLLNHIAIEKFKRGECCIVIDPHGDLAVNLLKSVPEERVNDVVYIDFSMNATPQLTIRENLDLKNPSLFADSMAETMRSATVKGDVMFGAKMMYFFTCAYFIYCICLDLSLVDIRTMFSKSDKGKKIRQKIKAQMHKYPIIVEFIDELEVTPYEALISVVARLSQLLVDQRSLRFLTTEENKISLNDIMSQGKLCIINLAIGKIGKTRASILAGLFDCLINNNIMARASIPYEKRTPVTLIKDEFYLGGHVNLDQQLTGMAKFKLSVIYAHQYLDQVDGFTRQALGTAGTIICFRLKQEDAERICRLLQISCNELTSLLQHTAYVKVEDKVIKFFTIRPNSQKKDCSEQIIQINLNTYYIRDVEQEAILEKDDLLTFDTLK